jgi:hypothetical protein
MNIWMLCDETQFLLLASHFNVAIALKSLFKIIVTHEKIEQRKDGDKDGLHFETPYFLTGRTVAGLMANASILVQTQDTALPWDRAKWTGPVADLGALETSAGYRQGIPTIGTVHPASIKWSPNVCCEEWRSLRFTVKISRIVNETCLALSRGWAGLRLLRFARSPICHEAARCYSGIEVRPLQAVVKHSGCL